MLHELHLLRHADRSADGRRPLQEQILRTDLQKRCQADGEDCQHTEYAHGAFQGRGACQQRFGRIGQDAPDHGHHAGHGRLRRAHGGGIRAAIKPGDVTKNDLNTVLPFGNTVVTIYITGEELLEVLEASTYSLPKAVGGFPQVAGINYTISTAVAYDANAETYPASTYYGPKSINRVTINSINGKDFKLGDTYAVVTNDFSAAGGDTYYAFKAATAKFDTGVPLDEAVMEYVTTELKGVIGAQYAAPQGRILMNPFKDVKVSSWFGKYVIDLYNDGIINGTSATTYAPNDTLTWAAALKLLLVSNGDLKAADATGADWSKNAIAKAAELGLVAADLDGAKAISRLEFCQVAAKLNKLAESKTESKFTDCADGYVMALVDAKVIDGMTATTFEPDASLTRAQIAKIIDQLNLIEK